MLLRLIAPRAPAPNSFGRPRGGHATTFQNISTACETTVTTSNSGLSATWLPTLNSKTQISLSAALLHQPTHHATLEALMPFSVLSLAACWVVGSLAWAARGHLTDSAQRRRSSKRSLQGPRQPQCRQGMPPPCVRASRHAIFAKLLARRCGKGPSQPAD